jgi:hypothetical protein
MSPESPNEMDKIPPPTDPNAADEFENLKTLVKRHVAAFTSQPRSHADLVREIDIRIRAAQDLETSVRQSPVPTTPAVESAHNNALLKALESRVAYQLLRKMLEGHCGPRCAPSN